MPEKAKSCLVGNDDSGPEDALDDLDLECGSPPFPTERLSSNVSLNFLK